MLPFQLAMVAMGSRVAPAPSITLTGTSVVNVTTPSSTAVTGYRVHSDGRVFSIKSSDGYGNIVVAQILSSTDWIIPNIDSGDATYHFQFTKNSGDTLDGGSDPIGSWEANNSGFLEWYFDSAVDEAYNATIEVSDDAGSTTIDSAVIVITQGII